MSKHSPTPWKWEPAKEYPEALEKLIDVDGREVCNFGVNESYYPTAGEAPSNDDQAFIIKAVNNHDKLVAACRAALSHIRYISRRDDLDLDKTDKILCDAIEAAE